MESNKDIYKIAEEWYEVAKFRSDLRADPKSYYEGYVDALKNKTVTADDYETAQAIVIAHEKEQKRLYRLKVDAFKKDLQEYFDNNLLDGMHKVQEFELRINNLGSGEIIPIEPCLEECYDGENNDDIKKLCEKHGVDFKIVYWCYHK